MINKKGVKLLIFMSIMLLFASSVFSLYFQCYKHPVEVLAAYNNGVVPKIKKQEGSTFYIKGRIAKSPAKSGAAVKKQLNNLKGVVNFKNAETELAEFRTDRVGNSQVYRFKQRHNNIPVYGREVIAVADSLGFVNNVMLSYNDKIEIKTTPHLNTTQAVNIVKQKNMKVLGAQLIVYSLYEYTPTLAYCITAESWGKAYDVIVNANTGEIIVYIPKTRGLAVTGNDLLGNSRTVNVYEDDGQYYLHDEERNISIYDIKNQTSGNMELVTSSASEANSFDADGFTLLANLADSYDYYKNNFNHIAYSGQEQEILGVIHFGTEYDNAFWTDANGGAIVVGDGGEEFYSLSRAKDVIAHEYQHGINTEVAGLIYLNSSGAIDEGLADLFGALIEDKEDNDFWGIAEDIMKAGGYLRNMANPHSTNQPSKLSDPQFKPFYTSGYPGSVEQSDFGGVHTNNSILTYAAYQMYINGISKETLANVWFNAIKLMPADSLFNHMRVAVVTAAEQLGVSTAEINIIKEAFAAVEVFGEEDELTLTYNGNGAISGTVPTPQTALFLEKETVAENEGSLQHASRQFLAWNTKANGTGTRYYPGDEITLTQNTTLFAEWVEKLWQDSTVAGLTSGEGTEENAYKITTANELAFIAWATNNNYGNYSAAHYIVMEDINLQNVSWNPIGKLSAFKGVFNGNGKTIYNLLVNNFGGTSLPLGGLFGEIRDAAITNLKIKGSVNSSQIMLAGGLAAKATNSKISKVVSEVSVRAGEAGGLVGEITETTVQDSYNTESIVSTITGAAGGIVARSKSGNIVTCFSAGLVSGANVGGIAGELTTGKTLILNCFRTKENQLSGNRIGGIVGYINLDAAAGSAINSCASAMAYSTLGSSRVGFMVGLGGGAFSNNIFDTSGECPSALPEASGNNASELVGLGLTQSYFGAAINTAGYFNFKNIEFYQTHLNATVANFGGFNFETVWAFTENALPTLLLLPEEEDPPQPQVFSVSLHNADMAQFIAINAAILQEGVEKDSSFSFTINIVSGYNYTNLQVAVNNMPLLPNQQGVYTVENVQENLVISITGIQEITEPEVPDPEDPEVPDPEEPEVPDPEEPDNGEGSGNGGNENGKTEPLVIWLNAGIVLLGVILFVAHTTTIIRPNTKEKNKNEPMARY